MFKFLLSLFYSVFKIIFNSRKNVILTMFLLKKENEIYRRHLNIQNRRLSFSDTDRFSFAMLNSLSKRANSHLTIVKPETVLDWKRRLIKNFWSYKHKTPGRKTVSKDLRKIILEMKSDNSTWGFKKISNELRKFHIDIHYTTVNKIIQNYRKRGLILPNGSWKKFLLMHWDSIFTMDFMTIDTLFGKRFYLLLIKVLKTGRIIRYDLTENPSREFVKQRIELFSEDFTENKVLIFDNAPQFTSIDHSWYYIKGVNICTSAPNINAYIEKLVGTIRREALDHFLLISEKQIKSILTKYIRYYNY